MSVREVKDDLARLQWVIEQIKGAADLDADQFEVHADRIYALTDDALKILAEARSQRESSAIVHRCDAPQSSVEIETMAKDSVPKITVKSYADDLVEAGNTALAEYQRVVAKTRALVEEGAA